MYNYKSISVDSKKAIQERREASIISLLYYSVYAMFRDTLSASRSFEKSMKSLEKILRSSNA